MLALLTAVVILALTPNKETCVKEMAKLCGDVERKGSTCFDCIRKNHPMLEPSCNGTGSGNYFCNASLPTVNKAQCIDAMGANCEPSSTCQSECLQKLFLEIQPLCHGTGCGKYICNSTTADCVRKVATVCPNQSDDPINCRKCIESNSVFSQCQPVEDELTNWYCEN